MLIPIVLGIQVGKTKENFSRQKCLQHEQRGSEGSEELFPKSYVE